MATTLFYEVKALQLTDLDIDSSLVDLDVLRSAVESKKSVDDRQLCLS
jgi:hypothetical protein